MAQYSETSAFWLFNRVSNFCYLRYDAMIPDVQKVQRELETLFVKEVAECDTRVATLSNDGRILNEINRFSNRLSTFPLRLFAEHIHFAYPTASTRKRRVAKRACITRRVVTVEATKARGHGCDRELNFVGITG